jgi:hypothetical protein
MLKKGLGTLKKFWKKLILAPAAWSCGVVLWRGLVIGRQIESLQSVCGIFLINFFSAVSIAMSILSLSSMALKVVDKKSIDSGLHKNKVPTNKGMNFDP